MNNTKLPLVSIIIPVFNREGLIEETLTSIIGQSYTNWECILVDDHSTDNTWNIINAFQEKYPQIRVVRRPDNKPKGACSCRNHGFELSKGTYVNWFDSDDIMHENFISSKVNKALENESIDGLISKTAFFKEDWTKPFDFEKRTQITKNVLEDFMSLKVTWYMPDIMWNRSFLKGKDLFDEELLMGQDRVFHIKMLCHNPRLALVDEYLTLYRKHQDSISATYFSKKYAAKTISHLHASIDLVDYLKNTGVLNENIKSVLYKSGIMYLPYTYNTEVNKELIAYLKQLFVLNKRTIKNKIKFYLALLMFKLTGKGYAILKL